MYRDKEKPLEREMDEKLVLRSINGQKDAFDSLVYRYQNSVHGYIGRKVQDEAAALDITQETFLTAYRSIEKCEKPASFKAWLLGIAHNCCKRWLEKNPRTPRPVDSCTLAKDSPDALFERQEMLGIIENELDRLPPDAREVFKLKYESHLKCEEIAQKLGKPIGTVVSHLSRTCQRLKQVLRSYFDKETL